MGASSSQPTGPPTQTQQAQTAAPPAPASASSEQQASNPRPSMRTSRHPLSPEEQMRLDALVAGREPPPASPKIRPNAFAAADLRPEDTVPLPFRDVFAEKIDVVPKAAIGMKRPENGEKIVFVRAEPETREELEQVRRTEYARLVCKSDKVLEPSAYKYSIMCALMGVPWCAFCPRKWSANIRYGPSILLFWFGTFLDQKENTRLCANMHPMPRWTIERARPAKELLAEMQETKRKLEEARLNGPDQPGGLTQQEMDLLTLDEYKKKNPRLVKQFD